MVYYKEIPKGAILSSVNLEAMSLEIVVGILGVTLMG